MLIHLIICGVLLLLGLVVYSLLVMSVDDEDS